MVVQSFIYCHAKNGVHGVFELPSMLSNFSLIIFLEGGREVSSFFNIIQFSIEKLSLNFFSEEIESSLNLHVVATGYCSTRSSSMCFSIATMFYFLSRQVSKTFAAIMIMISAFVGKRCSLS